MAKQLLWEPGTEIAVGDDAEAFCRACLALHQDGDTWTAMQHAAQARVRTEYGADGFRAKLREILGPPAPVR